MKRRVHGVVVAAIVVGSIAPTGRAAVLPAPGVITGGLLNRCEDFAYYSPPPWSTASASFTLTGRVIYNGAALTVTRGHGAMDIVCAFNQYLGNNAHLVLTVPTPAGAVTIDCSGDYFEGGAGFGFLSGVPFPLPSPLEGIASDFAGYCDPAAPIGKRPYIRVQFLLLGPDRDPSPTVEAFTIVGAYLMDGCGRTICIRRSDVFPPLAD